MEKNNMIYVANRLRNGKWALDADSFTSLAKLIDGKLTSESGFLSKLGNAVVSLLPHKTVDSSNPDLDGGFEAGSGMTEIIPVNGILVKGVSEDTEKELWLCDIDSLRESIEASASDPAVSEIILNFNSPGGEITGIAELGRYIDFVDTNIKPVKAWSETLCCSAAYWLASQCRDIGVTPSARIGNVGAFVLMVDRSEAIKESGVKIIPIYAGKYKMLGHGILPVTDEDMAIVQADIDKTYEQFKGDILSKRPISDANLQGLTYSGDDSLTINISDCVADTQEEYLTVETLSIEENNSDMKRNLIKANTVPITIQAVAVEETIATPVAVAPVVAEAPKEEPAKEEEKKADVDDTDSKSAKAENGKVTCPHCNKAFSMENTPEKEEKNESEEKDEPKKEAAAETVVAVATAPQVVAETKPMGLFEALGMSKVKKANSLHDAFAQAVSERTK
jgi:ClpP class serine protease